MIPYDLDQSGWGSTKLYADGLLAGRWDPQYTIIHWGGGTSQVPADSEAQRLRIWQRYHIHSRGWQDIAYNYAVGDSGLIYRLRGENHGGHTSGVDVETGEPWNVVGMGVVWIGGLADPDGPSEAAKDAMSRVCRAAGYPVLGHRETGKRTQCPGSDWIQWIAQRPWEENMWPTFGDIDDAGLRRFSVETWQLKLAHLEGFTYVSGSTNPPIVAAGMRRGVYDQAMEALVDKWTDTDGGGIGPRQGAQIDAQQ